MIVSNVKKDFITARKNKDKEVSDTLRLVVAAFDNEKIKLKRDLTEAEAIDVLKAHIKTVRATVISEVEIEKKDELALILKESGKDERAKVLNEIADKKLPENAEFQLINKYLPKFLNEEEILAIFKEKGAKKGMSLKELMPMIMKEHRSEVDGALVNRIAKREFME